eukprot:GHVN01013170.1.p1 GENE.GHVN01013170.1~~GHVN01013170.1.p1  ORF type:complete len:158 (+),score=27.28 GHVN01013170.1:63-536(+)
MLCEFRGPKFISSHFSSTRITLSAPKYIPPDQFNHLSHISTQLTNPLLCRDDDVTRYDRAFDTNDIKVFVELLTSNQRIDQVEERMHPWAAEPQTVGALCATQLAVLASRDSIASDVKESIRELGGIPPLVKLLDSHDEDRVHASTIVLSFLSVESE